MRCLRTGSPCAVALPWPSLRVGLRRAVFRLGLASLRFAPLAGFLRSLGLRLGCRRGDGDLAARLLDRGDGSFRRPRDLRSEEPTSELQSPMRISYSVLCLKKKKTI